MNSDEKEPAKDSDAPQRPPEPPDPVELHASDLVSIVSALRIDLKRNGEVFAHREAGAIPQQSDSTVDADGLVHSMLQGTPAQNEGRTLETCHALVKTLRQRGERWHLPQLVGQSDDCDCTSQSLDDVEQHLRIQHVRVLTDSATWRDLAMAKLYTSQASEVSVLAQAIRDAIQKKAQRTAKVQRAELALALDSMTTSAFALGPVVRAFRAAHGTWCKDLGFRSVWLVGPSDETTYRLDQRDLRDSA